MSGRGKKFLALGVAVVLCLAAAAVMGSLFHWKVTCTPAAFAESSRRLSNPDRGFYYIYGYRITDEPVDYATDLRDRTKEDDGTRLGMMQINLREYRTGAISEEGMSNVRQRTATRNGSSVSSMTGTGRTSSMNRRILTLYCSIWSRWEMCSGSITAVSIRFRDSLSATGGR